MSFGARKKSCLRHRDVTYTSEVPPLCPSVPGCFLCPSLIVTSAASADLNSLPSTDKCDFIWAISGLQCKQAGVFLCRFVCSGNEINSFASSANPVWGPVGDHQSNPHKSRRWQSNVKVSRAMNGLLSLTVSSARLEETPQTGESQLSGLSACSLDRVWRLLSLMWTRGNNTLLFFAA